MKVAAAKVIKSKTVSGGQPIGHTDIHFAYSGYTIRDDGSNKSLVLAYPVNLIITATGTVTLPQWTGAVAATTEDKDKWQKLIDDLNTHEQVHVCIGLTTFDTLKLQSLNIHGEGKTNLKAEADLKAKIPKTFQAIVDDDQKKQTKYDDETDNGTQEAEQKEYNKQITSDCNSKYLKN